MSKSVGNVIDPFEVVQKYGTDALRFWCAREMSTFEDGDFTWEKFKEAYNGSLANGIGNLASRVIKMAINYGVEMPVLQVVYKPNEHLDKFEIQKAAIEIWGQITKADQYIQEKEPFKVFKTNPEKAKEDVKYLLEELYSIAFSLQPFLPDTAMKILNALKGGKVGELPPLFPRAE